MVISTFLISFTLLFFAPLKSSSEFVFTDYFNSTNIPNSFYVANIGIMVSLYCISGYDSAGQIGEETDDPETTAPKSIINSVILSIITSFLFILITIYNIGG